MKFVTFESQPLSKLSFGTVQLGLNYGISNRKGKPTQETANEIIAYLVEEGVNCFDTAVAYGDSEEVLGHALSVQNKINLISKVKSHVFTTNLEETIYQSLTRLQTDKLFGLLLHDSKLLFEWNEEHTSMVTGLQNKNLIDYFGVSIYTAEEFDLAIENTTIKIIQIPFNLFDQRAVTHEWFKKAKDANKLVFIRSIFLQGLFYMSPDQLTGNLTDAIPYLQDMHNIRTKLNLSVTEFAMAYVDTVASDAVILFGCDTLAQAKENITAYNNLSRIEKEILDTINIKFSNIQEAIINPSQWCL